MYVKLQKAFLMQNSMTRTVHALCDFITGSWWHFLIILWLCISASADYVMIFLYGCFSWSCEYLSQYHLIMWLLVWVSVSWHVTTYLSNSWSYDYLSLFQLIMWLLASEYLLIVYCISFLFWYHISWTKVYRNTH